MKTLFLAWQDPESRSWYPIGRLTHDGARYRFVYTHGAEDAGREANFSLLAPFDSLDKVYESDELLALFSNRLLARSRPDYGDFVRSLDLTEDVDDPVALLARSGGRRATDSFEVFPCPEPDEHGLYHIHFFAHGLRHLPDSSLERIKRLERGEQLLMVADFQNPYDQRALMLRTDNSLDRDLHIVGYCPRYLLPDVFKLLEECSELPRIAVERVNPSPTPLQLRLLCNMTARWPGNEFAPFSGKPYQPIPEDGPESI